MQTKPNLSFWQIWNMSFGFMGIQFGWGLQMANMSSIYENLGAKPEEIPGLWLAAPLTGLLVQPIIGYMSDRTWHPTFGRRRPYFLIGAILSSLCLFIMPNASTLWMAAGLLWILDSSINISMEPFRAFVADKLPEKQRTIGFSMQSFFIGIGATIASALPWIFTNWFNVDSTSLPGHVANNVKWSFYLGGIAFIGAVLYTVLTTKEYPPSDIDIEEKKAEEKKGFGAGFQEISHAIMNMPKRMKQLALIQFVTWPGLFLMWFYYTPTVAAEIFGGETGSKLYSDGQNYAGLTYSFENVVTFLFALALPFLAGRFGKKWTHFICLMIGGFGLVSINLITGPDSKILLFGVMAFVGIAWSSILSMPYSMLTDCLPANKIGIYMGIFNFFIVLPEIIASLFFGKVMEGVLDGSRIAAVTIGGVLLMLAAVLTLRIKED
ncbi:MAG: MFS transporter [Flavobacteriales bacterium]|nr:MFS transporter [Flavobacteriales bacterium]NCA21079.1 MFS transporter [Crocinitomicaceae bacterium]